jgi:hypothetical protein
MHVLIAGGRRNYADDEHYPHAGRPQRQAPVILLYGNKNWESITFREELEALKEAA